MLVGRITTIHGVFTPIMHELERSGCGKKSR
jgi:hypothetical protein